ncbi:MAG: radical SAM protein [Candidatus Omnitrophota bacterium]
MIITGITYQCNFNCLFCLDSLNKTSSQPTLSEIKTSFKKIAKKGEDTIMFMKGESFLRPDIFEILKMAKEFNFKIKITTNGSMLSNDNFLKKVLDCDVKQLNFSIHSHIPKIANALSRNPLCYASQKKALVNINRYSRSQKEAKKIKIFLNIVVNKLNYSHLNHLIVYIKDILSDSNFRIKFKFMLYNEGDPTTYKKLLPSFREIKPYLLKSIHELDSIKTVDTFTLSGFPLCILPKYEWTSIELQEFLIHKNLFIEKESFLKLGKSLKENYNYYDECRICSLYKFCPGIPKGYFLVYPKFDLTVSKRKKFEIIRKMKGLPFFHNT